MTTPETGVRPLVVGIFGTETDPDRWSAALRSVEAVEVERLGAASPENVLAALSRGAIDAVALTGATPDLPGVIKRALLSARNVLVTHTPALASKQLMALGEQARRRNCVLMFDTGAVEDERIAFVRRMTAGPSALWRPRYVRSLRTGAADWLSIDECAIADIAFVLRFFEASPAVVSAIAPRFDDGSGASDVVMATLSFPGGQAATIDVSLVEPEVRHEVVVACPDRTVVLDHAPTRAPLQIVAPGRHREGQSAAWRETVSEYPSAEFIDRRLRVAAAFCGAVRARDALASNAVELADAAAVWEAARRSIQMGGEPVEVQPRIAEQERPQLRLIAGGGRGDGVSAGALKVVPATRPVEVPLSSA